MKQSEMNEQKEGYKIIVMLVLLAGACALTYYFHAILDYGRVFTHFFYIPIILAALWWRRKGMVVAIFLAILLIFSNIFVRAPPVAPDDYLRAVMFIVIAGVVAMVSEMIGRVEAKITHLNAVLRSIRKVNQLIAMEKDCERLLKGACELLVEIRGYRKAWIVLLDEAGKPVKSKEAGWGDAFMPMIERLKRGEQPYCVRRALSEPGVAVIHDPRTTCADCPLADKYEGMGVMTLRLEHDGKLYGLLSVSVPEECTADEEERTLFIELASDIAFALRSIELEEVMKRERDKLHSIFETIPDGVSVISRDYKVEFMNRVMKDELGDHVGDICYKVFHGREEPCPLCKLQDVMRGKTVRWEWFSHRVNKTYDIIETPMRNIDGTISKLAIFRDITERKRMEESLQKLSKELEEERDYVRHLSESSPDFMLTLDKEGKIMDVNEAFLHLTGRSREDITGRYIHEYIPEAETKRLISEIFDKGRVRNRELMVDMPGRGRLTWSISGTVVKTSKGEERIYLTGRDLTELRAKELQLIQAGRLASLGEMATGVAHEINQPLSVISMAAESTLRDIERDRLDMSMLPRDMEEILKNVKRIDRIITHMRTFARQPEEWKRVEPEELLDNAFILLGAQFRVHNISVSRSVDKDLPAIMVDPNQMEQVFVNILTNARQALDERGEAAAEEGVKFEKKLVCRISREKIEGAEYVVFEFADNAYGVPDELKTRIFEPFFTTKEAGEGTGLGLSIAYNIVTRSLGGKIWVEDNDMGGASFKVALPVVG